MRPPPVLMIHEKGNSFLHTVTKRGERPLCQRKKHTLSKKRRGGSRGTGSALSKKA